MSASSCSAPIGFGLDSIVEMLSATLGWSWADPIAALAVAGWAAQGQRAIADPCSPRGLAAPRTNPSGAPDETAVVRPSDHAGTVEIR